MYLLGYYLDISFSPCVISPLHARMIIANRITDFHIVVHTRSVRGSIVPLFVIASIGNGKLTRAIPRYIAGNWLTCQG